MIGRLLFILIFCVAGFSGLAKNADDSVPVNRISEDRMQEFLDDDAFDYIDQESRARETWWERIQKTIRDLFLNLAGSNVFGVIFRIVLYLIILAAFLLIVMRLTDLSFRSIFYSNTKSQAGWDTEDVREFHNADFNELALQAAERKQFKLAVRYEFRNLLQQLSTEDVIRWKPHKRNIDYAGEIRTEALKNKFLYLARIFEYVWYGDFLIDEETYGKISGQFRSVLIKSDEK